MIDHPVLIRCVCDHTSIFFIYFYLLDIGLAF